MPRIAVNGVELYFEEHGSGDPILFHHGFTGSHDGRVPIAERLRDRYRCILMDARGAGDSERAEGGYAIEQYAADVIGLATALGLERFTYVGHSMGGGIGWWLGLEHADRLDRLVLVAPIPADGIEASDELFERARELRERGARDVMIRERLATAARPEQARDEEVARAVDRSLSSSDGHFIDSWQAMREFKVGDRLGELATPTLMIVGAADNLLRANVGDFLRLPKATLHVFSRVGHGVFVDVPDAFAEVIADFMMNGVVTAETLQERLEAAQLAAQ